jgi:hypothetical protein
MEILGEMSDPIKVFSLEEEYVHYLTSVILDQCASAIQPLNSIELL